MLVAADVGNSGIKVGAFEGEDLVVAARMPPGAADLALVLGVPRSRIEAVVAVSVSEPALAAFLGGPGRGALVLGRDLPLLVPNRYANPAEVGRDRLVLAAAAHARSGGPAIVVDLGSAVTVDAVGADGAFLGGAIAPGLPAFRAGLRAAAPALPAIPDGEPEPGVPRSTADALRAGAILGLAGLVTRLVRETAGAMAAAGDADGEVPVYLTGGDAERIRRRLEFSAEVVPHLTLRGVAILYARAGRAAS